MSRNAVISRVDRHVAELGRDCGAGSADERGKEGTQFTNHGHDDDAALQSAGAEPRQLRPGLGNDQNAQQQCDGVRHSKRIDACEQNLSGNDSEGFAAALSRRHDEIEKGLGRESGKRCEIAVSGNRRSPTHPIMPRTELCDDPHPQMAMRPGLQVTEL
jgi:hypothetical protein